MMDVSLSGSVISPNSDTSHGNTSRAEPNDTSRAEPNDTSGAEPNDTGCVIVDNAIKYDEVPSISHEL